MKTALYVGNFSFPFGNAAGKRVYANGKILRVLGYQVVYVGMSGKRRLSLPLRASKGSYDGFTHYSFPYPQKTLDWLNYRRRFKELVQVLTEEQLIDSLDLVICYGSPSVSLFNTRLHRFCRRRGIRFVSDCVDWLTTKTENPFFDLAKWMDNTYQKAYVSKKADGVIAISRYLGDYYDTAGCKTVVIPPLSPFKYEVPQPIYNLKDGKIIVYAGQPFRKGNRITDLSGMKDRIDETIVLFHAAKQIGCKFVFHVYGLTEDEYLCAIPSHRRYLDELGDNVCFHGVKSNNEVINVVRSSDFSILIRDVNRASTAGFPTKVSESISCGTPVITTKTSDLDEYIFDGINGFFLDTQNMKKAVRQLCEILNKSKDEIHEMKRNCAESNVFYFEEYIERTRHFLNDIEMIGVGEGNWMSG